MIIESDTKMYFDYGEENGWVATNYIEIHDRDGNFLGYAASDINITGFINRMFRGVTIYFLLQGR